MFPLLPHRPVQVPDLDQSASFSLSEKNRQLRRVLPPDVKGVRIFSRIAVSSTALGMVALTTDLGTTSKVEQEFFPVRNSMKKYYLNLNFQPVKLSSLKDLKWKTNKVILTGYAPDWRVFIKSTTNKIKYFNTQLNWVTWWAIQTLLSPPQAGNDREGNTRGTV